SMGFTPLAGVPMGTRSGDIDYSAVEYLAKKEGKTVSEMLNYLNKQCGVLGVSGVSSDFRDLSEAAGNGNERAELALNMFTYATKKYIGAYAAALNGVDVIVFTAGIGENDSAVRSKALKDLDYLGVKLDEKKNANCPRGTIAEIQAKDSRVKVLVIPTNEELVIARETMVEAKLG
ncbi:MAG: acetate kinase, partial [Firmicutes bacterium]|nr:acetate kinase [Bacillota bacterium]